jgi:hypothetical protein
MNGAWIFTISRPKNICQSGFYLDAAFSVADPVFFRKKERKKERKKDPE